MTNLNQAGLEAANAHWKKSGYRVFTDKRVAKVIHAYLYVAEEDGNRRKTIKDFFVRSIAIIDEAIAKMHKENPNLFEEKAKRNVRRG